MRHSDHGSGFFRQSRDWLLPAILVCIAAIAQGAQQPAPQEVADLIVLDARIHTMDATDSVHTAIACRGDRILAVGSNAEIQRLQGAGTKVIEAAGRTVVPGFNDSHVHFLAGGQQLSAVQLRDAKSPDEFVSRLREYAATIPAGQWITGGDWDHENWSSGELPDRSWIDAVTAEHPVLISRLDGHMALANSRALQLGAVTKETADPDGGLIVRNAGTGEPTGILKDAAMSLVSRKIPAASVEAKLRAAQAATDYAASLGVTSVQDMSGAADIDVFRELQRQGNLKTRIYAFAPLPAWQTSADRGLQAAKGDVWIREGGLKGFADGSLGSTTALFCEPYLDDPQTVGLPGDEMFPDGVMLQRIQGADRAGLQVAVHATGDRANDQMLTIFDRVSRINGTKERRFRIEHAQHLRLQDVSRFADTGVIASMQPMHCADDGRWALKRIGPERARGTYAFRSLLDAGVILAFGSDWNVATLDPLQGVAAAVTRQTTDGQNPDGWVPEQKISVTEAIRAWTVGSATAEFAETYKGRLQRGMLADMVILSTDIFSVPAEQLWRAQVLTTIVGGRVVYERAVKSP